MLSGLLTRREQLVVAFFVAALFVGGAAIWWQRHRTTGITVTHGDAGGISISEQENGASGEKVVQDSGEHSGEEARRGDTESATQVGEINISVAGAVSTPGVYKLPVGSVVEDAVIAAGGYAENADPGGINRAARLINGTTLTVPAKPTLYAEGDSAPVLKIPPPARNIPAYMPGSVPPTASAAASLGKEVTLPARKVNINAASSEELQTLPRIGPKMAAAIIEYRSNRPFMSIEDIQNVPKIGPKTFEGLKRLITVYEE